MKMKFTCLTILIFCLLVTVASAKMEIHPYLSIEEEYNDNINLSDNDEQEDWITTVNPGINFSLQQRSLDASLDYSLEYDFYKNNSEDNQDEFKDIQRADASAVFFPGRPFTLSLSENISREAIDRRDVFSPENSRINQTTVYDTSVVPEYRWQLTPTFSLVFGYEYSRLDYVDPLGEDSQKHKGRTSLVKILSESLDISANYYYSVYDADGVDSDYDEQSATLGVTYQLSARTKFSLEGGVTEIEYDQDGLTENQTTWNADLSYQLTSAIDFSFNYSQDFSGSVTQGLTKTRSAALTGTFKREVLISSCTLFWDNSKYLREVREDTSYGVRADISRQLSRYLTLGVDGEYERAKFDDIVQSKEVDRFSVGTSLSLDYRRFLFALGYDYRLNDSDLDGDDYSNNIVTLSASVRF